MDSKTKITVVGSAIFSIVLGLSVLVGWVFGISILIKIHPDFTPMTIGAATSFVLSGFTLWLSLLQKCTLNLLIRVLGTIIAIIASLFLLEHLLSINLFVDLSDIHRPFSHQLIPGRMAINTAIAFFLFSIGLLMLSYQHEIQIQRALYKISSYLSLVIIFIALMGLLGYLMHLEELYAWTSLSRMAFHTTIGLIILGYGLWNLSLYKLKEITFAPQKNKILTTSFAMMMLISIITSIASFATLEELIEKSIFNDYRTRVID